MYTVDNGMLHYESCGLPNVWLKGGFEIKETPYGKGVSVKDIEGLHNVLGLSIARDKPTLSKEEIRFLRIELEMAQTTLAALLGVGETTVRNWESGRVKMPKTAERLLRTIYIATVSKDEDGCCKIKELVEHLSQLNRDAHWDRVELDLKDNESEWSAQVA